MTDTKMDLPINRLDAPPGTRAYASGGKWGYCCSDCHFLESPCPHRPQSGYLWCGDHSREDSRNVVFMTPEEHALAKAKLEW